LFRDLTLTGSRMAVTGCEALGRLLPEWSMLSTLKLDACSITDAAADALARGIAAREVPRLQHLAFGGNLVGPVGLRSLVGVFDHCKALKTLDVSCTSMSAPPAVLPLDQVIPDYLSNLDHRRSTAAAPAAGGAPPGARTLKRQVTAESMHTGTGGVGRDGAGHMMLIWGKESVDALGPMLRRIEKIKVDRCVWEYEALNAFLTHVSLNAHITVCGLHLNSCVEVPSGPPRCLSIAHILWKLHQRSATPDVSDLLSLSFAGLPAGDLDKLVQKRANTAKLASKLRSIVVRCPLTQGQDTRAVVPSKTASTNGQQVPNSDSMFDVHKPW
jgi:hypothetical protein